MFQYSLDKLYDQGQRFCELCWYGMAWHGMVWYGMVWYGYLISPEGAFTLLKIWSDNHTQNCCELVAIVSTLALLQCDVHSNHAVQNIPIWELFTRE